MTTKHQFTLEDVRKFCEPRKIILFDAEEYAGKNPSKKMIESRKVAWSWLEGALDRQRRL